jgi:glycosyltransferase involved in cell wall biosynthesis
MKVLIDHSSPFLLAHGGAQVQIEQTKSALERIGIEVEFVRWWDDQQRGDVIHYFGSIPHHYLDLAHQKKIPVVLTAILSSTCNRSNFRLSLQRIVVRTLLSVPGWSSIQRQLQWSTFRKADTVVVGLNTECRVLERVYGVPRDRIAIVPLGLDEPYLQSMSKSVRESHLITVGTIRDVKRSVDLAKMAREAEVPILFVGDPYSDEDPYWHRFQGLIDGHFVMHKPHVHDTGVIKDLYSRARGFALFSQYENWSLATHEASACGLPLLLPNMKWSRECFGDGATYFPGDNFKMNSQILRDFYNAAPSLPSPHDGLYSWDYVALQLVDVYNTVLRSV